MFSVSNIKVSELAGIFDDKNSVTSKRLKKYDLPLQLSKGRITGASPEAVENYFRQQGHDYLFHTYISVHTGIAGGIGKTSSCISLAAANRRMTDRSKPVVVIDADSQASTTHQLLGKTLEDDEFVLDDYLSGQCKLKDLLVPVGNKEDNIWLVPSSLNNVYLDRRFSSGGKVRSLMKGLFESIIKTFGDGARIHVDCPPQLSAVQQSSICALAQMQKINSTILLPLRSDLVSVQGARIAIKELEELKESYKGVDDLNIQVFLSSYDARLKVSVDTMRSLLSDPVLQEHVCPIVIRYSSEVTKAAMRFENIYSSGSRSNITNDYMDLALYLLGWNNEKGAK